jgi:hypothetical protein
MSKTPTFRPMSEYSPRRFAQPALVLYTLHKDGEGIYLHRLSCDDSGVWRNDEGLVPICWLDFNCYASRPLREIVEAAHRNSDYQFADDSYFDKQIWQLKKLQKRR